MRMLRAVVTLGRTLHFGAAAGELGVASSSLSEQVAAFERLVGAPLFVRTSRVVTPTALGREVISRSAGVVEEHDRLRAWLDDLEQAASRSVRIGFLGGLDTGLTTGVLRETRRQLPEWSVSVHQLGFTAAERALLEGHVDVALAPTPVDLDSVRLRGTQIWHEPRVLMVEADHPFSGRSGVTLAEIAEEVVITPSAGRHPAARWWAVDPRPDGTPVRYGPPARDLQEVVQLVAAGMGVNITAASAERSLAHPGVAFIPLLDVEDSYVWVLARAGERSRGVFAVEDAARSVGADLIRARDEAERPSAG